MSGLKTYSHLMSQKRKPTEYETVCSDLLYYVKNGFEVNVPLQKWYSQYQRGSPLQSQNWEQFCDPRETTYTKYIALQRDKEIFVEGILSSIDETNYDASLTAGWLDALNLILGTLRYLWHGLQMTSCYVGQMAPSGKIVVASMFQAADEMRRVQKITYRMRQLQLTHPDLCQKSKETWQNNALWQPMRELIEKLLITYDWGESFIALNCVVKPIIDDLFLCHFSHCGKQHGDILLDEIFFSFREDCLWHREWCAVLIRILTQERSENIPVIQNWIGKWYPMVQRAIVPWTLLFSKYHLAIESGTSIEVATMSASSVNALTVTSDSIFSVIISDYTQFINSVNVNIHIEPEKGAA